MQKRERHQLIKDIIEKEQICRQEDIVEVLSMRGIHVTQATVSRDMKEMQLIKLPLDNGEYRYSMPTTHKINARKKLTKLLKDSYIFSDYTSTFCYLKVLPGNGPALARLVEQMNYPEVFAVMEGDDAVMIFSRTSQHAKEIHDKIFGLLAE